MFKSVALTAALATAALSAAPAAAQGKAWQVGNDSMYLYNADMDMNSRAALLARAEAAAARLCRDRGDARGCADDTVAATMQGPAAAPLRLALSERGAVRVAAR